LKNYSDTLKTIICLTVFFIVGAIEFMLVLAVTRIGRYYRTTALREVRKFWSLMRMMRLSGFLKMIKLL